MNEIVLEWAGRINHSWAATAKGIVETGALLIEAKAALAHGEWESVKNCLPFDVRTAERLMEIGRNPLFAKPSILPLLPGEWTRCHKLAKITDEEELTRRLHEMSPINGSRAIMGSRVEPDDSLDFFPTPPWAVRALFEHVIGDSWKNSTALEPACGEGHIAEVLTEYFGEVWSADIHDYGYGGEADFLDISWERPFHWIITNPPFGDKTEAFVLRAIERATVGVAMFVRLQWLEGIGRYERIFKDLPPTKIAFFAERVPLCKGRWDPDGTTATAYIWLVWRKPNFPLAPFWIPPGQREALTYPDDIERFTAHPVIKKSGVPHPPAEPAGASSARLANASAGSPPCEDIPDFLRRA